MKSGEIARERLGLFDLFLPALFTRATRVGGGAKNLQIKFPGFVDLREDIFVIFVLY